ncbi:MAG TPA: hypothetical protein VM487_14300 [Phycisphaerae bacterium]|nr:hypothetical protein [Phycisphaerae bacterium]
MSDAAPLAIAVVCEGPADQRTATTLADRVVCEAKDWIEAERLDQFRVWCGVLGNSSFLAWRDVPGAAEARSIKAHGHFCGEPGAPDARQARRALFVVRSVDPPASAVLLIRDADTQAARLRGLRQARDATNWSFAVVIAVARPKRECWLLAAFEPTDDVEKARLASLRKELGFDPRIRPQELTATHDRDKRSTKRVIGELSGRSADRAERDLERTPLETLKKRGAENGLRDYLRELEQRLVPLF